MCVCMIVFESRHSKHVFIDFLASSHQNKAIASVKLDAIRKTVEERSKNLKLLIDNHRQILVDCIDNYIENLENVLVFETKI